jgi:NAD(P)-dependent dehydrogenase (short-subunit alcohol dehydrogenase family)
MNHTIKYKRALVTGGSRGIGATILRSNKQCYTI